MSRAGGVRSLLQPQAAHRTGFASTTLATPTRFSLLCPKEEYYCRYIVAQRRSAHSLYEQHEIGRAGVGARRFRMEKRVAFVWLNILKTTPPPYSPYYWFSFPCRHVCTSGTDRTWVSHQTALTRISISDTSRERKQKWALQRIFWRPGWKKALLLFF